MASTCGICGARMLSYENPPRELCPRVSKHHLYLTGGTVGGKGRKKKKKGT